MNEQLAEGRYERLGAQDASFLFFESHDTPMHVASLAILDARPLQIEGGGVDIERVAKQVESRLPLMPRYRMKLLQHPLGGPPVWVDDERFDLSYHVRHTRVPRPGDADSLKALTGHVISLPLDRGRPLWELWVVEGLERDRFAMLYKIHHSMVDGVSGMSLMSLLFSTDRDEPERPTPAWTPEPVPGGAQLWFEEGQRVAREAGELLRQLGERARQPARALEGAWRSASALLQSANAGLRRRAQTPLNERIGPHRRFELARVDLARLKAIRRRLDVTINDVILATVAGAMRRYLGGRGIQVHDLDYRVVIPVNMRRTDDDMRAANRVSAIFVTLPLDEADPLRRIEQVRRRILRQKRSHAAEGIAMVTDLADRLGANWMVRLGVALASRIEPYNLIVTNVPGPQSPLYLLGARLLEMYPGVPLFDHQGLGVAVVSYDGGVFFGLTGDRDLAHDLGDLAGAIGASLDELVEAAEAA